VDRSIALKSRTRLFAAFLCLALALGLCAVVAPGVRSQNDAPLRRITFTPERTLNLNPTISGDGRRIAFESTDDPPAATNGSAGFHTLRADITGEGATFTRIAASRAPAPALSRDGSRLAFASRENLTGENADGNSEIFSYDGERLQQITNTSPRDPAQRISDGNFQPSITSDGNSLAFASNRNLTGANPDANLEIFIYDSLTRTTTQVTGTTGTIGASDAKISGDGSRVAFIRDNGETNSPEASSQRDLLLYERAQNSTRVIATAVEGLALTYGRATSDDGERIVYAAQEAARTTQVFLYDGRNDQLRKLTALGSRAADVPLHPTISGDGARVAFATRRNVNGGNSDASVELYVYDFISLRTCWQTLPTSS
jgi:Tol biopolymer transport system component